MVVAVIAIGIWHTVALMHYGRQFAYDYFIRHLFVRTTQVLEGHAGTGAWSSYLEAIPNKGRPWGGFGLLMMVVAAWRVLIKKEKSHLLPLVWAAVVLVLFSLAKTKNHWYIIPIYPAFAVMLGWGASRLFKGYAVAAVAMLTLSALIYLSFEKRIFKLDYSPEAKRMALSVKAQLPQHGKVYLYRMSDPGMLFYFGDVFEDIPENRITQLLSEPNRYIAMERNTLASLAPFRYAFVEQSKDFVVVKTQP
jgi:4-amino-4-deoxy-L-arabinose transferase-like glycosyltransferase